MRVNKQLREAVEVTDKIQMLMQSISEVSKYELLTTNQYLQQMEIVLAIFDDISKEIIGSKPLNI